jgi:hypothetical protein
MFFNIDHHYAKIGATIKKITDSHKVVDFFTKNQSA